MVLHESDTTGLRASLQTRPPDVLIPRRLLRVSRDLSVVPTGGPYRQGPVVKGHKIGLRTTLVRHESDEEILSRIEAASDTDHHSGHRYRAVFLSPYKLGKVEHLARRLLNHANQHRRYVPSKALRSFAGLANYTGLAVVDARLQFRELCDALDFSDPPSAGVPSSRGQSPQRSEPKASYAAEFSLSPSPALQRSRQPRISHAVLRDLKWWASIITNPHVCRYIW